MWLLLLVRLLGATAAVVSGPGVVDARWPIALDPGSGCSCKRAAPEGHVACFDLVTCVRFPSNVTVRPYHGVAIFHVRATRIPELGVGDLATLKHLTELCVDNSHALVRVVPGAFQGMSLLVNLSLSFHPKLTHLEPGTLVGLSALRELTLVRNGFLALGDVTPALATATLPSLRVLVLAENVLRSVSAEDFRPMVGSPLQELSLASCDLAELHPDGLAPLQQLASLRLADNHLDAATLAASLDHLGARGVALRRLDLASMGLSLGLRAAGRLPATTTAGSSSGRKDSWTSPNVTHTTEASESSLTPGVSSTPDHWDLSDSPFQLLQAIARSQVTELILEHNELERLRPGLFPHMPGLRRLDLSHMDLIEGRAGALSADVIPDLEHLDLSGNRLPGLEPGFVSPHLLSLDLSASAAAYFDVHTGAFRAMNRLQSLNLSYERVFRLTNQTFSGLDSLQILTIRNSSIFKIDDGSFAPLRSLELLDLQRNLFPMYRPLRADMFLGLDGLRVLLLGGCGIHSLGPDPDVFRHLANLTQLGLQDNALTTLDETQAFRPLRALELLDISRNRVGSWRSARLFDHNDNLREVRLAGNRLTYLTVPMLEDAASVDVVDLADNTFHCGCELYRPVRVHIDQGANITRLKQLGKYKCLSPDRWWNHSLAEYVEWVTAHSACQGRGPDGHAGAGAGVGTPTMLLVGLPLGLLLLLLVGSAGAAYRYRHLLRYYFGTARREARTAGGEMAVYFNYQYDAFVSYSSEDQAFVHHLVMTLENEEPHYRLCVYERDFAVGAAITEEVLGSVASSRRVILVVSPAFARSHWCAWEAHIAHHQRLLSEDALLVVRLGPVDESLLTPTLRYLLSARIYLEWRDDAPPERQRDFWQKMRAALAPPIRAQPP